MTVPSFFVSLGGGVRDFKGSVITWKYQEICFIINLEHIPSHQ